MHFRNELAADSKYSQPGNGHCKLFRTDLAPSQMTFPMNERDLTVIAKDSMRDLRSLDPTIIQHYRKPFGQPGSTEISR